MRVGVDVLIEKPLATSVAEADELIALARQHGRVAQAGHLERFNPAVRATLPLLTQPMFFEVHRLSVFTPRSLDVDVILDLMIHDLDVVLTFAKSPVRRSARSACRSYRKKWTSRMFAWSLNRAAWPTSRPAGSAPSESASCASSSRINIFRSTIRGRMSWC